MDPLVQQDHLDHKALLDHQEALVSLVPQEHLVAVLLDLLVPPDHLAEMVALDHQDQQGFLDLKDLLDLEDLQDNRVDKITCRIFMEQTAWLIFRFLTENQSLLPRVYWITWK